MCIANIRALAAPWTLFGQTGAERATGPVIELPPMVVDEKVEPLRWSYLGLPQMEVLSVCSDSATRTLVQRYLRLEQLLPMLIPREFRPDPSVRNVYIFFNEQTARIKGQEVVNEVAKGRVGGGKRVRFSPNMRLSDVDANAVFVIIREHEMVQRNVKHLEFTPG